MYYIGIDLGGTIIKTALVKEGRIIDIARMASDSGHGLSARLIPLADCINDLIQRSGTATSDIGGINIAFPGIVNVRQKKVLATNAKYDDAPDVDLNTWAHDNWNLPLVIDNDARMATVGEWHYGAGMGLKNMVMMTIGTGIGTGVIIDGRLLYGPNYCAGSLGGHLIVDYRGRRCTCGNVGCAEAHGSSFFLPDIIRECATLSESFKDHAGEATFEALCEKVRIGDKEAALVLRECMDVWCAAIVNYVHAYDPERIVIGGGIMKSADLILPYLREKVNNLAWRPWGNVEIEASLLGDHAAMVAADIYFSNHKMEEYVS